MELTVLVKTDGLGRRQENSRGISPQARKPVHDRNFMLAKPIGVSEIRNRLLLVRQYFKSEPSFNLAIAASQMRQLQLIPRSSESLKPRTQHGGSLALGKRRSKRPLSLKKSTHLVLQSDLAKGPRSLLKHQPLIKRILRKYSLKFRVRVYQTAICGNHVHTLVLGKTRTEMQNFFRVVAGQIAQEILRLHPLQKNETRAFTGCPESTAHPKNQRAFWSVVLYSRIVSWGREFKVVMAYILQNTKEALGLVAYKDRGQQGRKNSS